MMFVKHPNYMGNNLSLHVGGGQKTIFDNDILEGAKWIRFVGMGFLRQCTDEEVEAVLRGRAKGHAVKAKEKEAKEIGAAIAADEGAKPPMASESSANEDAKPPMSRSEHLLAMDPGDLYKIAQEIELYGRMKLKGNKDGLVSAILEHEEAEASREAAKIEAEAEVAAQEKAEAKAKAKAEAVKAAEADAAAEAKAEADAAAETEAAKAAEADAAAEAKAEGGTTKSPKVPAPKL